MRVYRRLVAEHGYQGGYDQVRRYVGSKRRRERETFIPLDHDPGRRAEADFRHIHVDFPEGRRLVPVLIVTWAFSYRVFAIALPTERTEAILHGLVEAFTFFGCVPKELWWDNPTTVAVQVLRGRERTLNDRYQALASHYNFEPLFCMPARGNEKPHVENRVKDLERRWATPVSRRPATSPSSNEHLKRCCIEDQDRVAAGQSGTIADRFERDRAAAIPLPQRPFDACLAQPAKVDKYQTVRFDAVAYSVPRSHAFQTVTVKAYVDRIAVVAAGQGRGADIRARTTAAQHGCSIPSIALTTLSREAGLPGSRPGSIATGRCRRPSPNCDGRWRSATDRSPARGNSSRVLLLLDHHPQEAAGRTRLLSNPPGKPLRPTRSSSASTAFATRSDRGRRTSPTHPVECPLRVDRDPRAPAART